jgi:hypothetical protein
VIRAVVSDFGGVLTAPLQGFARIQAETGVPAEAFGAARALGFAAVHFRDTPQAIAELDALVGARSGRAGG